MISIFNKKYRNIVCNQKNENKETISNTIERNENIMENNKINDKIFNKNIYSQTLENDLEILKEEMYIQKENPINETEKHIYSDFKIEEKNNNIINKNYLNSEKKSINRNEFNKNLALSFVVSPINKDPNFISKSNNPFQLNNSNNNNNNFNNTQNQSSQINNDPKYSKSFVVKPNIISTNPNNQNLNIVNLIKNKGINANNSKNKNRLLKKFPNKAKLTIGKSKNKNIMKKNSVKKEKKFLKIKNIKESLNNNNIIQNNYNNQNNINKSNLNNFYSQIYSTNKKSNSKNNQEELTSKINSNPFSNNISGITNLLNNNYFKKIIKNNTNDQLNDNNFNVDNIKNKHLKNEEKSFYSDSFQHVQSKTENKNNLMKNIDNDDCIESNIPENHFIYSNFDFKYMNQELNHLNFEKPEKKTINKINITNNLFNKNAILDISATYDPDLDSRNGTSIERSKSTNKRDRFHKFQQISISPKRESNLNILDIKNSDSNSIYYSNLNSINKNFTDISEVNNENYKNNINIRCYNNIRDSSLSSNNSNFNENPTINHNAYYSKNMKNNNNNLNYESVRFVDNTNDIISNYDSVNFNLGEKNKSK